MIKIQSPLSYEEIKDLKAGDFIYLSGTIYTARDAAHARLVTLIENNQPLPFDLTDAVIYYVGPTPTKPGEIIGSCGPTTSTRMDKYTPTMIQNGLRGMIGKGNRSQEVIQNIKNHHAIYFCGIGGTAALTADAVISSELVCYEDLGAEAILKLEVVDMPLIVAIDTCGNDLFQRSKYE